MRITKSIQLRVVIALERNQKRIRCLESEFEETARFGIRDPFNKKRFVAGFGIYEDTTGGFFAYFTEAFKIAARKAWHITPKEDNK